MIFMGYVSFREGNGWTVLLSNCQRMTTWQFCVYVTHFGMVSSRDPFGKVKWVFPKIGLPKMDDL